MADLRLTTVATFCSSNASDQTAQDAEVKETDAGDEISRRACWIALLGVVFCPPLFTFYSLWLQARLFFGTMPLSNVGTRNFRIALALNFAACAELGCLLASMSFIPR